MDIPKSESERTHFHRIRLHGPWEMQTDTSKYEKTRQEPPSRRVRVPGNWASWLDSEGRPQFPVRMQRRFSRPTGLVPQQRIWLQVTSRNLTAEVRINAKPVGTTSEGLFRIEFAALLNSRNLLELTFLASEFDARGELEEVCLQIEDLPGPRD